MTEKIETGSVLTGKVTGIQPYGAFIALDENTQGLVHISEITHGYVNVKVLSIDENAGKIGLSIRATEEAPVQQAVAKPKKPRKRQAAAIVPEVEGQQGFNTLKDKLQEWIDQSQREDLIKK
jgi:general stress protein 13